MACQIGLLRPRLACSRLRMFRSALFTQGQVSGPRRPVTREEVTRSRLGTAESATRPRTSLVTTAAQVRRTAFVTLPAQNLAGCPLNFPDFKETPLRAFALAVTTYFWNSSLTIFLI